MFILFLNFIDRQFLSAILFLKIFIALFRRLFETFQTLEIWHRHDHIESYRLFILQYLYCPIFGFTFL